MSYVGTTLEPVALEVEQPVTGDLLTSTVETLASSDLLNTTIQEEAFMTLLMAINDTRKRIVILSLLSFLAMC